jgi:hypothetical protein
MSGRKPPKSNKKAFNQWAEREFQTLVRRLIAENGAGKVARVTVLQECSFALDVSPATVSRYLAKYTADRGPFRYGRDGVTIGLNR